ncbi:MAG: C4-dicarboxylate TRAP transporter substrate-binding protein [Sphaerochaetaceae bacterium]|nr:C4-dicarboxylate TRAP transporter substrate-binding protein [uncultured Sphaerochaeta sp.]MDC7229384.1 C4-dicarboxylate TRAP transporter substrate-binding protein [Sphaerochaetaceae bacterium]
MKKRLLIGIMLVALLMPIMAQGAAEQKGDQEYLLRFGHVLTPEDTFHKQYLEWAKAVSERTDGKLKIEVYPSAQLGVEEDVLEQIRLGSNVGWQTDPARLGNYVKEWGILYMPFFLSGIDDVEQLLDSKVIQGWVNELEEKHQIKVVSYAWVQGFRNVFTNKPGKSPSELRNSLIRTANAPAWLATVNSLGSKAVALAYGELYNGIQTKVVDGCELPYAAAKQLKVYEVADYIVETQHIFQLNVMVVSSAWFNKLPADYQAILIEECNNAGLDASNILLQNAEADRQFMIDQGMTYIPHSDLDVEAFIESGEKAYESLGLAEAKAAVYAELGK